MKKTLVLGGMEQNSRLPEGISSYSDAMLQKVWFCGVWKANCG